MLPGMLPGRVIAALAHQPATVLMAETPVLRRRCPSSRRRRPPGPSPPSPPSAPARTEAGRCLSPSPSWGERYGAGVVDADVRAQTLWFATEYVLGPPLDEAVELAVRCLRRPYGPWGRRRAGRWDSCTRPRSYTVTSNPPTSSAPPTGPRLSTSVSPGRPVTTTSPGSGSPSAPPPSCRRSLVPVLARCLDSPTGTALRPSRPPATGSSSPAAPPCARSRCSEVPRRPARPGPGAVPVPPRYPTAVSATERRRGTGEPVPQYSTSTSPVCTSGLPRLRETKTPRPAGIGRGRTPPRMSPSAGSPASTRPWAPSSFMRCMNGS